MKFDSTERTVLLCGGIFIAVMCILIPLKDKPDIATGLSGGFLGIFFLSLAGCVYFLPTIIGRRKRNIMAIFFLNLVLGWTIIGWIVAMTWALTKDVPSTV